MQQIFLTFNSLEQWERYLRKRNQWLKQKNLVRLILKILVFIVDIILVIFGNVKMGDKTVFSTEFPFYFIPIPHLPVL